MVNTGGKTVLMIDDSPEALLLAKKIIESEGITFFEASNVADGIRSIEENSPHLVLTDLKMPEQDGFEFLRLRRTRADLSAIPVLVLSGMNDHDSVHKAISLGALDYIIKPFRAGLLIQKVRKALQSASFPLPRSPVPQFASRFPRRSLAPVRSGSLSNQPSNRQATPSSKSNQPSSAISDVRM
jgi:PleD family two-component response regulator